MWSQFTKDVVILSLPIRSLTIELEDEINFARFGIIANQEIINLMNKMYVKNIPVNPIILWNNKYHTLYKINNIWYICIGELEIDNLKLNIGQVITIGITVDSIKSDNIKYQFISLNAFKNLEDCTYESYKFV